MLAVDDDSWEEKAIELRACSDKQLGVIELCRPFSLSQPQLERSNYTSAPIQVLNLMKSCYSSLHIV